MHREKNETLFYMQLVSVVLFMYVIQHCFNCRPSDSTVPGMLGSNSGLSRLWH